MTLVLLESNKLSGGHLQAKMQEISSLQCSDLHIHLAAEGPSPWPAAPGCHVSRAAWSPAELGQAASNGLVLDVGFTSPCKQTSGDEEHLDLQTSR